MKILPTPTIPRHPVLGVAVVGLWAFLDPSLLVDAVSTLLAGTAAAAGLGLVVTSQVRWGAMGQGGPQIISWMTRSGSHGEDPPIFQNRLKSMNYAV